MTDALERRVSALEERLRLVDGLRVATDRDLSDLTQTVRAQHSLVQALSITQSEHTGALRRIEDTLQVHGEILQTHSEMLQSHGEALQSQGEMLRSQGEMLQANTEAVEALREDHGAKLDRIVGLLTDLTGRGAQGNQN